MNYTPKNLASLIKHIPYDEEIKIFKQHTFEFDDADVEVTGNVFGTFEYIEGDYWSPTYNIQTGQVADLCEIIVGYDEETKFLDGTEIDEIEKLLKW